MKKRSRWMVLSAQGLLLEPKKLCNRLESRENLMWWGTQNSGPCVEKKSAQNKLFVLLHLVSVIGCFVCFFFICLCGYSVSGQLLATWLYVCP